MRDAKKAKMGLARAAHLKLPPSVGTPEKVITLMEKVLWPGAISRAVMCGRDCPCPD